MISAFSIRMRAVPVPTVPKPMMPTLIDFFDVIISTLKNFLPRCAAARLDLHRVHDGENIRRRPLDPAEDLWHRYPFIFTRLFSNNHA
jgi:hypothetical protein